MTLQIQNFGQYQRIAVTTAVYPGALDQGSVEGLSYATLGLTGEAGEVANKVKKILRDHDGVITMEHRLALKKELGDVLWYAAALATQIGVTLDEVAEGNIDKLLSRQERGTLRGDGDDR